MKNILFIITLLSAVAICQPDKAQTNLNDMSEMVNSEDLNSLYGIFGFTASLSGLDILPSLNYERSLWRYKQKYLSNILVKGSISVQEYFSVEAVFLTGRRKKHFELHAGTAVYFFDGLFPMPSGGIAYRFQKPEGGFLFRTGVSFPEGAHVSFGLTF